MKPLLISFLSILFFDGLLYAQKFDSSYGKPLVVLAITDPWSMVIGDDVPHFALYEKGQVIFRVLENRKWILKEVTLSHEEQKSFLKSLAIPDNIYNLKERYDLSLFGHPGSHILQLDLAQKKKIMVIANLTWDTLARSHTPKEFLFIFDKIMQYKNPSAHPWLPDKIEVMFWEFKGGLFRRNWPEEFPDLNSAETVKSENELYSVFISKQQFPGFKKFHDSIGRHTTVRINGRKMALSYRLPFPNISTVF